MIRFAGANGALLRKRCRTSPSSSALSNHQQQPRRITLLQHPHDTRRSSSSSAREERKECGSFEKTSQTTTRTQRNPAEVNKVRQGKEAWGMYFDNSAAGTNSSPGRTSPILPEQKQGHHAWKSWDMSVASKAGSLTRLSSAGAPAAPTPGLATMMSSRGGSTTRNNNRQSPPRHASHDRRQHSMPPRKSSSDISEFLRKNIGTNRTYQSEKLWNGSTSSSPSPSTMLPPIINKGLNTYPRYSRDSSRMSSPTTTPETSSAVSKFIRNMPPIAPSDASLKHRHSIAPRRGVPASGGLFDLKSSLPSPLTPTTQNDKPTLTQFINDLQKRHEKEQQELKEKRAASTQLGTPKSTEPLPRWRMFADQSNLRDMRKQERGRRQKPVPDFGQRDARPLKAVYVDPKDQIVTIPSYPVTLAEASLIFREKTRLLLRKLRRLGENTSARRDMMIEPATMELLAIDLNRKAQLAESKGDLNDDAILIQRRADQEAAISNGYDALPPRAPVVTIMGHVDHGKTTLMDNLRRRSLANVVTEGKGSKKKSKKTASGKQQNTSLDIAGTEAGGITQVISAFQVPLDGMDQAVTFLDTPGHAAFKAMRQSGSDAADVIVLVVAADDGVSKQTIEILDFYKSIVKEAGENGISLVIAMNKIDKSGINVEEARRRIERELQEQGIPVEGIDSEYGTGFGLPVEIYPVSGLTGEGLDDFIEGLALQAEVMDLRADDSTRAEGLVMDARVDKGVGIVVDTVVRWGSIRKGDVVVSGTATGKVRLLKDMNGQAIKQGLPSQPVRIIGFDSVPKAGDPVVCVESEEVAGELVERRKALEAKGDRARSVEASDAELQSSGKHLLHNEWREKLQAKHGIDAESDSLIRIPVVIKADADGTLAAVRECLMAIGDESIHNLIVDPVRIGVGPVLASDIQLAKEGGATIFAFNLKHEQTIASMADEEKVSLVTSKVIYSLLEDAKVEFANYLPAEPIEVIHGRGKVQAVFDIGGMNDKVAGLRVTEGTLFKDKAASKNGTKLKSEYRIVRGGKTVSDNSFTASSLKYFKDDVSEVGRGKECGLSLSGCSVFEEGDEVECFSIEMKREFV